MIPSSTRRSADRQRDDKNAALAANWALREELARIRAFMLATPAVGPWETIRDQYDHLLDEQEQERQEAVTNHEGESDAG